MKIVRAGVAMAPLFFGGPVAWADAYREALSYRETVVVSGVYRARSDFDLPFAIDRIDAHTIADGQPGINLSEVLGRVPGIVVQNRQNYAQDLQISARGFGARAAFGVRGIKLIADGIPASTPDGQGQAATFNLDVADRIEILRGPAATLYGTNAGGVLQLFSRDGAGAPRINIDQAFGSDGLDKLRVTAEGAHDDIGFLLNASRFETDGYRDHSATRRDQVFGKVNVAPDDKSRLQLIYSALEQDGTDDPLGQTWQGWREDPRSVTANALLYDTRKSIDHQQLGVNYERDFAAGTLQSNLYAGRRHVLQFLAIPASAPTNVSGDGGVVDFEREFVGAGLRWLQANAIAGGELHSTFGIDINRSSDDRRGFQNFAGPVVLGVKGALRRDERDTIGTVEPYWQSDWAAARWTVAAGLRYSRFASDVDDDFLANGDDGGSRRDSATTGSLGIAYALTSSDSLYANVGRGYETPTLTEQAYAADGSRGFNGALQPSRSTQAEIGWKTAIAETARATLAVFQVDTDDEIVVSTSSGGRTSYANAGATRRRGVEFGIEAALSERWRVNAAYTWLDAVYAEAVIAGGRIIDSGNALPGVPRNSAFAEIEWRPRADLSTALEAQYRDVVEVEDTNSATPAPSYTAINWRAQWRQAFGNWSLQQTLRVDNLLDRHYVGSVIVNEANARYYEAAPGRTWYAGIGLGYQFD